MVQDESLNSHWGKRTLMNFQHATEIVDGKGEGLLVLTDSNKIRQIVIPVDHKTLDWFRDWKKDDKKQERHLPDILVNVLRKEHVQLEIDIDHISGGIYQAILTNSQTLDQYPININDALILNRMSNGLIPILIDSVLFLRQSSPYDESMKGVSMPINVLSDSMLEKALQESVEKENYELAAQIQKEIEKRAK